MCGIAGFFALQAQPSSMGAAMLAALARRGPDAAQQQGFNQAGQPNAGDAIYNALLHARLAIVDPRPIANQPMSSDDGQIWLCYNGEVYDWEADKQTLLAAGAVFRTHSDSEFILRAYEAWGWEGLLPRLRGMFAFALVDWRQQKVYLARDRMGEKPLLYSLQDGQLAFGSLVRSVLPFVPPAQRQLSSTAIDAYLAHRYIPAPATIFSAIQRLENGHYLVFDLHSRQLTKHAYWQAQPQAGDWLPELDRAVTMRTVADRPLGVLLSGGIDSTVVASRLALHHPTPVSSFTAAFPGSSLDESADAADTAQRLGLPHTIINMPQDLAADFTQIVADLDQPFADPSSFPTWYLARAVSQQVKVVLVGDGGDELLAGYKRFNKHLRTRWRQNLRLPLPIRPSLHSKGMGKLAAELAMDWHSAYALRFSGFTPSQRCFLQDGQPLAQLAYWRAPDPHHGTHHKADLASLLALDFANYLPDYILQKSDLCTMAHGLESRAPLLDHQLYQTLLKVPAAQRYTQPAKQLLRRAMHPALPTDFFSRKKRGFNPPLNTWLKTSLAPRLAGLGQRLAQLTQGQLNAQAVDAFVRAYQEGTESLAEQLLQLLILDESLGQLLEGRQRS